MMMISGSVTDHAIAADNTNGVAGSGDFVWVYNASTLRFEPNNDTRTALDSTTRGPWRVTSFSSVQIRVGGGTQDAQTPFEDAFIQHTNFDEDSNITFSNFSFGTITQGDTVTATRTNTMVVHRNAIGTRLFPADRCTWQTVSDGNRGYAVNNAQFYPGNAAPITILDPVLGYIGKSGRFVEIAG